MTYDTSRLWREGLGSEDTDESRSERERLRVAFERVRERASVIAAMISENHPEFTVHDISHLDALWELADLIGGPDLKVNPAETFVLGCAFLVHDLGMSLASYPGGIAEVMRHPSWTETLVALLALAL